MSEVLRFVKLVEGFGVQKCDRLRQIWKSCQSRVLRRRQIAMRTAGGCIVAAPVDRLSIGMGKILDLEMQSIKMQGNHLPKMFGTAGTALAAFAPTSVLHF
jgi:hypothetical protein